MIKRFIIEDKKVRDKSFNMVRLLIRLVGEDPNFNHEDEIAVRGSLTEVAMKL